MPWQIPLSISNTRLLLLRTGATHAHHNIVQQTHAYVSAKEASQRRGRAHPGPAQSAGMEAAPEGGEGSGAKGPNPPEERGAGRRGARAPPSRHPPPASALAIATTAPRRARRPAAWPGPGACRPVGCPGDPERGWMAAMMAAMTHWESGTHACAGAVRRAHGAP